MSLFIKQNGEAVCEKEGAHFEVRTSTVRKIIHEWRTFKTVDNLPRSECPSKLTPRSDSIMLRGIATNPRTQNLHASVSMLNSKVHDSTIRKRLNKCLERFPGDSLFSLQSIMDLVKG